MKKGTMKKNRFIEIMLWGVLTIYLFPLYLQITIALKSPDDFAKNNFGLPEKMIFGNIARAAREMEVLKVTGNSLIILVVSLLLILLFSSMAAYSIARRRSKIYKNIYTFFIAGMMIPLQLIMIPLYKVINGLHIMNTFLAVICIYVAINIPFGIVILSGFMKTIPIELDEAAKIDGASMFSIFWRIILPLIKAPIITVMIFSAVSIWNDLLIPLLFLGSEKQTIVMALYNFKGATYTTDWTMVFAGSLIAILPLFIVFLFSQKYFIEGMVAGAVKG